MRNLNYLIFIFVLFASCSENDSNRTENVNEKLLGNWIEVSPCESCNTLRFSKDTIFLEFKSDDRIYEIYYEIVAENSIEVTRLWDIEESKKTTIHEFEFLNQERMLIKQFMPSDAGTTGFTDIELIKNE